MLHFWDNYWGLRLAECPCDQHFVEWLDEKNISHQTIFHFGTGGHHLLGIHNVENKRDNAIFGITAAPKEHETYEELIIKDPKIGWAYKVFFGDIYQLDARLLPEFDIVTLFHVGEFRTEANDAYGALTDLEMVRVLLSKTRNGGKVLFYNGSYAYNLAQIVIEQLLKDGVIIESGTYKTLPIFTRTGVRC